MHTIMRNKLKLAAVLLVVLALLGSGLNQGSAFAKTISAATLPPTTCLSTGVGTVTCDLWARTGSVTMPGGASVTIWGYTDSVSGTAGLPGPALIVNQGDVVTVNLTNELPEATSLLLQGQNIVPDMVGAVANTGVATYTFTASTPGTYLYEAGLLANAEHQVAMGLYGALIVRPSAAPLQAYTDASTAFNDEALVVLSELDPALNNSAIPAAFDMRNYKPAYWLINGQAYPNTLPIETLAGNKVLLRYVNAGLQLHSMGVLGLHQSLVGMDGSPALNPRLAVADTISAGQTLDALVTIPTATVNGSKFALYDANMLLHNNNSTSTGGMLTFLTVGTSSTGSDTTGPDTNAMALSPSATNGAVDVALSASLSDVASGGSNISAAEYFIDTTGANGTGTAMSGAFGSPTAAVNATLTAATLTALPAGNHTIYIHGQDSAGNWGTFNFAVLTLDKVGPASTGLVLNPNPTNGSVNVSLSATGNDQTSGNSNVAAAEFFIGAAGANGTGTTMAVNAPAPVASLTASIPAAVVVALAEGPQTIYVHARDALGNWGAFSTITLTLDKAGPVTSTVVASVNPNNGTIPYNSNTAALHLTGSFSDAFSKMAAAEGFIDTVGVNGKGYPFIAGDGFFNSPNETGYVNIPLTTINLLAQGNHTLYVHGKDTSGNWGSTSTTTLVIDKTKPTISAVAATPNPTNTASSNNLSFVLTATASDAATGNTNITTAEWFEGADPGPGRGNAMQAVDGSYNSPTESVTATVNFVTLNWTTGNHTVYVRTRDAVGYWSLTSSVVVNVVQPNLIFSDGFESANFALWSATGGTAGRISVTAASAQAGSFGMAALVSGGTSGYAQNNAPTNETSYHARFYFNPANLTNVNATARTIFVGLNSANANVFTVQLRRNGGNYQVSAVVSRAGGTTTTNWFNIGNTGFTAIEIGWQNAASASFTLYTGGTLRQTLTALNTSAFTLDTVQLGPQGTLGTVGGTAYFDSFASTRNTVVGP
jgi:FtsP/CotA-like multicopper oxidase with cupredoxin domain